MDKRHYNWSWFDYFWVQVDWGWSQSPCSNSWACAETGFIGCYYIAGFIAKEQMRLNCGVGEDSWKSLDCKEIQPAHSEGDQPWDFLGRNDAKAEAPVLWPPHVKSWLIAKDSDAGRDWGQEEKGTIQDEMAAWHHGLDGRQYEWTPGDGDGQGGLACCYSWGCKESDTTEQLNWTELISFSHENMGIFQNSSCSW